MGLLLELVIGLALKPLLVAKVSCQIGARTLCIVVLTWLELLRFALSLHFVILWRFAIWVMALLSLPVRAFNALYRERMLEMQILQLKNEMESVLLDAKELEEQLHEAINEREMTEMLLVKLEKEHDEAILKIKLLEGEVQDLKNEALRLKEVKGKSLWCYLDHEITSANNIGKSPYKLDRDKKEKMTDYPNDDALKSGSELYGFSHLYIARMISAEGQRKVALSRSLFSVLLSLVVGIIVWEAKDPCIPLVIALFVVVAISLLSVLQLLTRIEHKPASELLALLSLNWFMLGTLAYPMLPQITRFLGPLALSVWQRTLE